MFYSMDAEFEYEQGTFNTGVPFGRGGDDRPPRPELNGEGMVVAWDPVTNSEVWRVEREGGNGGTMSTAGNLVFWAGGGRIHAQHAETGEELWSAFVGGSTATPVTYELDGRQYIAVEVNASGGGGRGRGGFGRGGGGRGGGGGGPQTPARMMAFVLDGAAIPDPPPPDDDDN